MTPEGRVKAGVIQYLRRMGWFPMINAQGAYTRGSASGRPDLEAIKRGVTIFVEVKAPKDKDALGRLRPAGKLSPYQEDYIKRLRNHGGIVLVVWSAEEFVRDLDEIENRLWPGENTMRLC